MKNKDGGYKNGNYFAGKKNHKILKDIFEHGLGHGWQQEPIDDEMFSRLADIIDISMKTACLKAVATVLWSIRKNGLDKTLDDIRHTGISDFIVKTENMFDQKQYEGLIEILALTLDKVNTHGREEDWKE